MKLGILDALSSPELNHITWQGSTADTYIRFLDSVDAPFSYAVYEVSSGHFPTAVDDCDAYLITGSIRGAYDEDAWIGALLQFYPGVPSSGQEDGGHLLRPSNIGPRAWRQE